MASEMEFNHNYFLECPHCHHGFLFYAARDGEEQLSEMSGLSCDEICQWSDDEYKRDQRDTH